MNAKRSPQAGPADLLEWADWVQDQSSYCSIDTISSYHCQRDGFYTTWTIKRFCHPAVTRATLREALQAARDQGH